MSAPRIVVSRSAGEYGRTAAGVILSQLDESLASGESTTIALAGGSTPLPVYSRLVGPPLGRGVDWNRVDFFFGDERAVPPEDPRSNFRLVRSALGGAVPEESMHRIRGELGAREAARDYERRLARHFGDTGTPRFDLVILGVGEDGHTASLFPGQVPAPGSQFNKGHVVEATRSPAPPHDRISLSLTVLNSAARIVFLATGSRKANVVARILGGDGGLPAAQVAPGTGSVCWVLDPAAASSLSLAGSGKTLLAAPVESER